MVAPLKFPVRIDSYPQTCDAETNIFLGFLELFNVSTSTTLTFDDIKKKYEEIKAHKNGYEILKINRVFNQKFCNDFIYINIEFQDKNLIKLPSYYIESLMADSNYFHDLFQNKNMDKYILKDISRDEFLMALHLCYKNIEDIDEKRINIFLNDLAKVEYINELLKLKPLAKIIQNFYYVYLKFILKNNKHDIEQAVSLIDKAKKNPVVNTYFDDYFSEVFSKITLYDEIYNNLKNLIIKNDLHFPKLMKCYAQWFQNSENEMDLDSSSSFSDSDPTDSWLELSDETLFK